MKVRYLTYTIIILISLTIGWAFGTDISLSEQISIYNSLLSVASIIFGIMGAWVAIIYPNALKEVFYCKYKAQYATKRLRKLFYPLRISVIVVCCCMMIPWLSPILKQISLLSLYPKVIRQFSFSLLTALLLLLLISLLFSMLSFDDSESEIISKDSHFDRKERRNNRLEQNKSD
jgi:hypothetical protein